MFHEVNMASLANVSSTWFNEAELFQWAKGLPFPPVSTPSLYCLYSNFDDQVSLCTLSMYKYAKLQESIDWQPPDVIDHGALVSLFVYMLAQLTAC